MKEKTDMATQVIKNGKTKRKAAPHAKAEAVARTKALAPDLAAHISNVPKTKFRSDPTSSAVLSRLMIAIAPCGR